jgi:DNA repair protein RadC
MYQVIQAKVATIKEPTEYYASNSSSAIEFCKDMVSLSQESLQILTLNVKNRIIDRHMITLGVLNYSFAHPREIFRACCNDSAAALIMIHNHPSGVTDPSEEDIKMTNKIIAAGGEVMGIPLLDSLIIAKMNGSIKYLSLRESGLCKFSS